MNETVVEIGELDRNGVILHLTSDEQRALRKAVGFINSEWRADGSVRVYSAGKVGSLSLSKNVIINVNTKVPVANVLFLAGLAYETLPIPASVGDTLIKSNATYIDWLAVLLVCEIEVLIANGLRQDYVIVRDELPYIRGRLQNKYEQTWARPGLSACEFADFLSDIPENRVLRSALEVLASRKLLPWLKIRVEDQLRNFQNVSFTQPTSHLLDQCRQIRLYAHYQPALDLSRLLFEQTGVEQQIGEHIVPAFFFPMEAVFEQAVTNFLRNRLRKIFRQSGRGHQPVTGAPTTTLSFTPDIIVGDPAILVIDTKYSKPEGKNQFGGMSFQNQHIYQAAFYGLSLGCPAVLLYPRAERDIKVTYEIEDVSVSLRTIDLEQPGVPDLEILAKEIDEVQRKYQAA